MLHSKVKHVQTIHLVNVACIALATCSGVLALQNMSPSIGHSFGKICSAMTKNMGPYSFRTPPATHSGRQPAPFNVTAAIPILSTI